MLITIKSVLMSVALIVLISRPAATQEIGFASASSKEEQQSAANAMSSTFFNMTHDAEVRKELELVDHQYKKLQKLYKERGHWYIEEYNLYLEENNIKDPTKEDGLKIREEVMEAIRKRARKQLESVLLPHQFKALEQLAVSRVRKKFGVSELILSKWTRNKLEIDDKQAAKIRATAEAESAKLMEEWVALKRRAEQKLLNELNPSQQTKLFEILPKEKLLSKVPNKDEKK